MANIILTNLCNYEVVENGTLVIIIVIYMLTKSGFFYGVFGGLTGLVQGILLQIEYTICLAF